MVGNTLHLVGKHCKLGEEPPTLGGEHPTLGEEHPTLGGNA